MGSKSFDLGWVNFLLLGWVSHLWFGSGFQKFQIFQFFSCQVKKCLGQRQVGLLFAAGQKNAWVVSGPTLTKNSILFFK